MAVNVTRLPMWLCAGVLACVVSTIFDAPLGAQVAPRISPVIPEMWSANDYIYAVGVDNNVLYAGGKFTLVRDNRGGDVLLNPSIGAWVEPFPKIEGGVIKCAAPDGTGGWYLGGTFTTVGGEARSRLAHVTAAGAVDMTWNPGANGNVDAMVYDSGLDVLYVAGAFTQLGGQSRSYLGALDGGAGTLLAWAQNLTPARTSGTPTMYNLHIDAATSDVYIAGAFNSFGGTTRNHAACIDSTGALTGWNPDITYAGGTGGYVLDIAITTARVFLAGLFDTVGGTARTDLAAVDRGGTGALQTWAPVLAKAGGSRPYARSVEPMSDGSLILGGEFTSVDGTTRYHLAAFLPNGTLATWNGAASGRVASITINEARKEIYIGFNQVLMGAGSGFYTDKIRNFMGSFSYTDLNTVAGYSSITAWNPMPAGPASVIKVDPSTGNILVGGATGPVGGISRPSLAAFDVNPTSPTFGQVTNWQPGTVSGSTATVETLIATNGIVYAGGTFTSVGGVARNYLCAIDANGVVLPTWNPSPSGTVYGLLADAATDTLYVVGAFTNIAANARNRLAALKLSDATIKAWNPGGSGADADVRDIVRDPATDTLYVSGNFTTIGGFAQKYVAAVSNVGVVNTAFAPIVTEHATAPAAFKPVMSLAFRDGRLYIGGNFPEINSIPRSFIAALDPSGNVLDWDGNIKYGGGSGYFGVHALEATRHAVFPGGNFVEVNGSVVRNCLAVLDADDALVTTWTSGYTAESAAYDIAISDHIMFAGGRFSAGTHPFLAAYWVGPEIRSNSVPNAVAGQAYNFTLDGEAIGSAAVWTITSGALPPTLTLDPNTGVISGTVQSTIGGTYYTFEVTVNTNSNVPAPYDTHSKSFTIFVAPGPTDTPPAVPFSTGFETSEFIPSTLDAGNRTRAMIVASAASTNNGGSMGLQMDTAPGFINWPLQGPNGPGKPAADDPARWVEADDYAGTLAWTLRNPAALTTLRTKFDWLAVRVGTFSKDWYANLLFEVNDGTGWRAVWGTDATVTSVGTGIYRSAAETAANAPFNTTDFTFTVAASATIDFRLHWLVKLSIDDPSFPTAMFVDNISIDDGAGVPPTLSITAPLTLPDASETIAYGPLAVAATGGTPTLSWTVTGLPTGMSFNQATLSIEGAPDAGTAVGSPYAVIITVSDSGVPQQVDVANLSLIVVGLNVPNITAPVALAAATEGVSYGPVALTASGGVLPYTWIVTGLPAGLVLGPAGNTIEGTPAAGIFVNSPYSVTITVTDGTLPTGQTDSVILSLVVNQSPLAAVTVTTLAVSGATERKAYTFALAATGGTGPYAWQVTAGVLPSGIILTNTGMLTGTPIAGTAVNSPYVFTVRALDTLGASNVQVLSLTVARQKLPTLGGGGCSISTDDTPMHYGALALAAALLVLVAVARRRRSARQG